MGEGLLGINDAREDGDVDYTEQSSKKMKEKDKDKKASQKSSVSGDKKKKDLKKTET